MTVSGAAGSLVIGSVVRRGLRSVGKREPDLVFGNKCDVGPQLGADYLVGIGEEPAKVIGWRSRGIAVDGIVGDPRRTVEALQPFHAAVDVEAIPIGDALLESHPAVNDREVRIINAVGTAA